MIKTIECAFVKISDIPEECIQKIEVIDNSSSVITTIEIENSRRSGKWNRLQFRLADGTARSCFRCNLCHYAEGFQAAFCASCGARMEKAGSNEVIDDEASV